MSVPSTPMSALRYHGNRDLRLETVPVPVAGANDVVVRIEYCAVCQTDVEEFLHGPIYIQHPDAEGNGKTNKITGEGIPMTVGHEAVGTIVSKGAAVTDLAAGDRCVFTMYACGKCWYCDPRNGGNVSQCDSWVVAGFMADGGLAEYMKFAQQGVVKVPAAVGENPGLALCEPCAVATRASRRGRVVAGETVAVLGAGAIGLLLVQVCKAKGCRVIVIDMREISLQLASQLGADATINAATEPDVGAAVKALTMGSFSNRPIDGPDCVFDCAAGKGAETAKIAISLARRGGRIVLVSVYGGAAKEVDFNSIVGTEKEIIGTLSMSRQDTEEAVRLIAEGKVDARPLVSATIGLDEVIGEGYRRMLSPAKDFFRIVVDPRLPSKLGPGEKPAGIEALAGLYEEVAAATADTTAATAEEEEQGPAGEEEAEGGTDAAEKQGVAKRQKLESVVEPCS